jgi:hypothetical protein
MKRDKREEKLVSRLRRLTRKIADLEMARSYVWEDLARLRGETSTVDYSWAWNNTKAEAGKGGDQTE